MTSDKKHIKYEQLHAQLALQYLGEHRQAIGPEPTTEELIILREGNLDPVRRAQVMSHIAATPNIYVDTLRLVDTTESLEISELDNDAYMLNTNSKFSLVSWLTSMFRVPTFAGAGLAATLALVVIQFTPPQGLSKDINQLYADYGQYESADFRSLPHFKRRGKIPPPEGQSAEYYAALGGVYIGAMELGKPLPTNWFPIEGYREDLLPNLEISHYSATYELGRLTTIAHFKCQSSNDNDKFFSKAVAAMKQLSTPMKSSAKDSILSKQLATWITEEESAREKVCGFAAELTHFLWQPPNSTTPSIKES